MLRENSSIMLLTILFINSFSWTLLGISLTIGSCSAIPITPSKQDPSEVVEFYNTEAQAHNRVLEIVKLANKGKDGTDAMTPVEVIEYTESPANKKISSNIIDRSDSLAKAIVQTAAMKAKLNMEKPELLDNVENPIEEGGTSMLPPKDLVMNVPTESAIPEGMTQGYGTGEALVKYASATPGYQPIPQTEASPYAVSEKKSDYVDQFENTTPQDTSEQTSSEEETSESENQDYESTEQYQNTAPRENSEQISSEDGQALPSEKPAGPTPAEKVAMPLKINDELKNEDANTLEPANVEAATVDTVVRAVRSKLREMEEKKQIDAIEESRNLPGIEEAQVENNKEIEETSTTDNEVKKLEGSLQKMRQVISKIEAENSNVTENENEVKDSQVTPQTTETNTKSQQDPSEEDSEEADEDSLGSAIKKVEKYQANEYPITNSKSKSSLNESEGELDLNLINKRETPFRDITSQEEAEAEGSKENEEISNESDAQETEENEIETEEVKSSKTVKTNKTLKDDDIQEKEREEDLISNEKSKEVVEYSGKHKSLNKTALAKKVKDTPKKDKDWTEVIIVDRRLIGDEKNKLENIEENKDKVVVTNADDIPMFPKEIILNENTENPSHIFRVETPGDKQLGKELIDHFIENFVFSPENNAGTTESLADEHATTLKPEEKIVTEDELVRELSKINAEEQVDVVNEDSFIENNRLRRGYYLNEIPNLINPKEMLPTEEKIQSVPTNIKSSEKKNNQELYFKSEHDLTEDTSKANREVVTTEPEKNVEALSTSQTSTAESTEENVKPPSEKYKDEPIEENIKGLSNENETENLTKNETADSKETSTEEILDSKKLNEKELTQTSKEDIIYYKPKLPKSKRANTKYPIENYESKAEATSAKTVSEISKEEIKEKQKSQGYQVHETITDVPLKEEEAKTESAPTEGSTVTLKEHSNTVDENVTHRPEDVDPEKHEYEVA